MRRINCLGLSNSDGSKSRLCTPEQWYDACLDGGPNNMTGDDEWVDEVVFSTNFYGVVRGTATCDDYAAGRIDSVTALNAFRCCIE